jgi:hypothetical protein
MNKFLTWFKNLVLPFENPEHPLFYSPTQEQDNTKVAVRAIFGDDFANYLYGETMTTPLNYQLPNTIRHDVPSMYGHWWVKSLKPQREAAREAARAAGYYDRHTHY